MFSAISDSTSDMEPSSTADIEPTKVTGRIPSLIDDYVSDFVQGNSANGLTTKDDSTPSSSLLTPPTVSTTSEPEIKKERETKFKKEVKSHIINCFKILFICIPI